MGSGKQQQDTHITPPEPSDAPAVVLSGSPASPQTRWGELFMARALELAREAALAGEAPVGAVIVRRGEIVGEGRNRREQGKSALLHAEIEAIAAACAALGGWRLWECELYVTLEPCPMCAGAIVNARIRRVIFGALDPKAGALVSRLRLFEAGLNHRPEAIGGVMADACGGVLSAFFRGKRFSKI